MQFYVSFLCAHVCCSSCSWWLLLGNLPSYLIKFIKRYLALASNKSNNLTGQKLLGLSIASWAFISGMKRIIWNKLWKTNTRRATGGCIHDFSLQVYATLPLNTEIGKQKCVILSFKPKNFKHPVPSSVLLFNLIGNCVFSLSTFSFFSKEDTVRCCKDFTIFEFITLAIMCHISMPSQLLLMM